MESKQWYVVNTYSGHENKVKEKLEMRINSMNMQDNILMNREINNINNSNI